MSFNLINGMLDKCFFKKTADDFPYTCFIAESNHRKYFAATSLGTIDQYNFRNGEVLVPIVKEKAIKKREEEGTAKKNNTSYEISQIHYCESQNLLFTVSCDSMVRSYTIEDGESILLGEFINGHLGFEILSLDYSPETLRLFTGATNGTIAMWNLEGAKLTQVFKDSDSEIVAIKALFPYAVVLAADKRGVVVCWQTLENDRADFHPKLFRISIGLGSGSPQEVNSMCLLRLEDHLQADARLFPDKDSYQKEVDRRTWLPKHGLKAVTFKEQALFMDWYSKLTDQKPNEKVYSSDEEGEATAKTPMQHRTLITTVSRLRMDFPKASTMLFGEEAEIADSSPAVKRRLMKRKAYLYIGFEEGNVCVIPVEYLLLNLAADRYNTKDYNAKRFDRYKVSIMRKERIDGSRICSQSLKSLALNQEVFGQKTTLLEASVSCRVWSTESHRLVVLNSFADPVKGVISCHTDGTVKLWNVKGELCAEVNVNTLVRSCWKFPFDFVDHQETQLVNSLPMLEVVGQRRLTAKEGDRAIAKYLVSNYLQVELSALAEARETQAKLERRRQFEKNLETKQVKDIETVPDADLVFSSMANFLNRRAESADPRTTSDLCKKLDLLFESPAAVVGETKRVTFSKSKDRAPKKTTEGVVAKKIDKPTAARPKSVGGITIGQLRPPKHVMQLLEGSQVKQKMVSAGCREFKDSSLKHFYKKILFRYTEDPNPPQERRGNWDQKVFARLISAEKRSKEPPAELDHQKNRETNKKSTKVKGFFIAKSRK